MAIFGVIDDFVQNQGVFSYLIGTLQPILQFNIYSCDHVKSLYALL